MNDALASLVSGVIDGISYSPSAQTFAPSDRKQSDTLKKNWHALDDLEKAGSTMRWTDEPQRNQAHERD